MTFQVVGPPPYGTLVNQIYQQSYYSLNWLDNLLTNSGTTATSESLATQATLVLDTLLNGIQLIDVSNVQAGVTLDLPALQQAASLPVSYSIGAAQALNNRIVGLSALQAALPSFSTFTVTGNASIYLNAGIPAIPDTNILATSVTWTGEPTPTGYVAGSLNEFAELNSGYWQSIVSGVANYYGSYPTPVLDSTVRASQGSTLVYNILNLLNINDAPISAISPAQVWNTAYALRATIAATRLVNPDLSLDNNQISMATRAFMLTMAEQLAGFIVLARGLAASSAGSSGSAVLSQSGQGLMDIAAQNLGSFENWSQLSGTIPGPWGAGSIPPGTNIPLASGTTGLTQAALLGTDLNLGAQNQPIPNWTGDFQLNVGIANYRSSLGRRLATTLGSLIYHTDYGSRIPPEIGQILTTGGQNLITAYGQSALMADPRTQSILSASTTSIAGSPNSVQFTANVQPIGPGLTPIAVNEVLSP